MTLAAVTPPVDGAANLETRVDWLHLPEPWIVFLVVLPALALTVWWLYSRETSNWSLPKRLVLVGLRFAIIAALVAILFEPVLITERVETEDSTILVLVDESYSMGIEDRFEPEEAKTRIPFLDAPENMTRAAVAERLLEDPKFDLIDRLRTKGDVRVLGFAGETRRIAEFTSIEEENDDPTRPKIELVPEGRVTRIGDAIYDAVGELRGERVSAVVLLTDGRDNGGRLSPEDAADRLGRRDIRVFPIGIGNPEEPRDLRVFGLDLAEVVLENDVVPVDFTVISKGFEGQVPARLFLIPENGAMPSRPIAERFITLRDSDEPQTHRLEFRPRFPGSYTARIEIPEQAGELFADNNRDEKPVKVISERIRVLYVDGPPRYEYRYLANALIRDPTMEAQILLTSADPRFTQLASPSVPPLDRFPTRREDLLEYHVVMIGDVDPDYFSDEQKSWIAELVDDVGGGAVFMAGPWHMPGEYRGSAIESLFPIKLEEGAFNAYNSASRADEFFVSVTPEGQTHPVMQLVEDSDRNSALWSQFGGTETRLPGFLWYAPVERVSRGAIALAVHSEERHPKYGPRPIFAFQYQGRGRTFMSLTDETWRWRYGVGNKYFYKFWGQVIRFVSAGRLLGSDQRFSVSTDSTEYTLGQTVNVLARVLDREFKPLRDDTTTLALERVGDRGQPVEDSRTEIAAAQTPGRPEYFEATLEARELGTHRIWIEERGETVASVEYRVVVPQVELAEPKMDQPRLEGIAKITGGRYFDPVNAADLPDAVEAYRLEIPVPADTRPLWDTGSILSCLVAFLTFEWILRKLFRLV